MNSIYWAHGETVRSLVDEMLVLASEDSDRFCQSILTESLLLNPALSHRDVRWSGSEGSLNDLRLRVALQPTVNDLRWISSNQDGEQNGEIRMLLVDEDAMVDIRQFYAGCGIATPEISSISSFVERQVFFRSGDRGTRATAEGLMSRIGWKSRHIDNGVIFSPEEN